MCVDTGAVHSIAKPSLLEKIGAKIIRSEEVPVIGLGGGKLETEGVTNLIMHTHGIQLEPATFRVSASARHDLMIGMDILVSNKIKVDMHNGCLVFPLNEAYSTSINLATNTCMTVCESLPLQVAESVVLESGKVSKVHVKPRIMEPKSRCPTCSPKHPEILLCTTDETCDIEVIPGIMAHDDIRHVLIAHNSPKNLRLTEGDQIAHLESFPTELIEPESLEKPQPQAIKFDLKLPGKEKERVERMLEEFKEIFDPNVKMGHTTIAPHKIELINDTPVYQKPRRFPEHIAREIQEECDKLELLDIIEPSTSAWNSPVLPVRRKDGRIRLVLDLRKVNLQTKKSKWPLPNISDIVYGLHGTKYFTCLDMIRAYQQIDLDPGSKEVTAFSTPKGHYQYAKLCFGLTNAATTFQREIQGVLKSLPPGKVIPYLDDILIVEDDFESHFKLVRKTLATLQAAGMKLNFEKCQWFQAEVKHLGHILNANGLRKAPEYMAKIAEYPKPRTVRQLREFLGLVNYQRKFIRNCSVTMAPLSRLTGGKAKDLVTWTPEMNESFESLRRSMTEQVELTYPDFSENAPPMELHVDASGYGAGACLIQRQKGEDKVISYGSTTFSAAQRNYSAIDRELAAMRWGMKFYRPFLLSRFSIVYSDHKPLMYLHNLKMTDSRLARTLEDIGEYNFHIRYKPGAQNYLADALSRVAGGTIADEIHYSRNEMPENFSHIRRVDGGGDALIESILLALKNVLVTKTHLRSPIPDTTDELRYMLVEELLKNVTIYRGTTGKNDMKCLRAMLQPGVMPVNDIILVASYLFGVRIMVHYGSEFRLEYVADKRLADSPSVTIH